MYRVTIKELKNIFYNKCKFVPAFYKSGCDINVEIKYDEIYRIIKEVLAIHGLTLIRRDIKHLPEVYSVIRVF